jgi:hypothetical protein
MSEKISISGTEHDKDDRMEMGLLKDETDREEASDKTDSATKKTDQVEKDDKSIRTLDFGRLCELAYPEVLIDFS